MGIHDDDFLSTVGKVKLQCTFLINSGQIRFLTRGGEYLSDSDKEEDTSLLAPEEDASSYTNGMDRSDLRQEMLFRAGVSYQSKSLPNVNVLPMLQKRQIGGQLQKGFSPYEQSQFSSVYLQNHQRNILRFPAKLFCGTYSYDGNIFLSACQDQVIRIYDVRNGYFKKFKEIRARDVGWSVLDTAFSPDGNYVIYSSWSHSVHICNIQGESMYETHNSLNLCPDTRGNFCAFSIRFSNDGKEILAGANDGCLYVFDREKNERTMRIESHEDDVSAVCFADQSSQILFSGADDGMCKVWDRRMLDGTNDTPVGILAGHFDGITYIDSKGDGRHLITNSKDQSIKLWDMRCFSPSAVVEASRRAVAQQHWDYRWQQPPRRCKRSRYIKGDTSLMTYKGHTVLHTLLRCRFSPEFSTGQRYIYAASATGSVIIYDVLTGDIVRKLPGHTQCVRDVSWHPYENKIISSGWDDYHILHEFRGVEGRTEDDEEEEDSNVSTDPSSGEEEREDRGPLRGNPFRFSHILRW